jgi:acyl-coenzyme A synthetase/AMP-(fatty) acid ligase
MHDEARLTTPRGTWNRRELANDPFGLVDRSLTRNFLSLSGSKSEEIVSALLVLEGQIPLVYLGEVDETVTNLVESNTLWVFLTSGSTGTPKKIAHTLGAITRDALACENTGATWGFFTDVTRMAGIQVVLEALSRGENLVIPDQEMSLVAKTQFVRDHGVTHLSATPSQFRQLLSVYDISSMPLKQITLGGEIADQKILDGLRSAFPESKITHVYATTETGPVLAVSDGLAGFPVAQLSKANNRIVLSEFHEVGVSDVFNDQIHWTGDLVELEGDRFKFVGRNSDVINVGGAKVNPATVETAILMHPDVQDCLVKGRESSVLGHLVVAEVVLRRVNDGIVDELRTLCKKSLPKYAVPRAFTIVEKISQSPTGKKVRE